MCVLIDLFFLFRRGLEWRAAALRRLKTFEFAGNSRAR